MSCGEFPNESCTNQERDGLYGVRAINAYLNTLSEKQFTLNHTYRLIAQGRIEARKSGPKVITSTNRVLKKGLPDLRTVLPLG